MSFTGLLGILLARGSALPFPRSFHRTAALLKFTAPFEQPLSKEDSSPVGS